MARKKKYRPNKFWRTQGEGEYQLFYARYTLVRCGRLYRGWGWFRVAHREKLEKQGYVFLPAAASFSQITESVWNHGTDDQHEELLDAR